MLAVHVMLLTKALYILQVDRIDDVELPGAPGASVVTSAVPDLAPKTAEAAPAQVPAPSLLRCLTVSARC